MSVQPPYLKKKDKVAIIATAKNFSKGDLDPAIDIISSWGLEVVLGKNVYNLHHQFSGTDEERIEDLQNALDDPSVKAIFCARGGYGTSRIIDQINFNKFKRKPKWLTGFSDVTVLHAHLNKLGIQSIHSIMPLLFTKPGSKASVDALKNILFGKEIKYKMESQPLNRKGNSKGELIGGNLSILNTIVGTKSDIDTKGKILFIEDIDEHLYHIDRMMVHLKRSGKLSKLSGLIVGHFTDMKDNTTPFGKSVQEIILDAVKEYKYPVCFNFPVGHEPQNLALICGRKAELKVGKKVELTF